MNWTEIIPAVRMLASKNGLVTCQLLNDSQADRKHTLTIDTPTTSAIQDAFKTWYNSNAVPPQFVAFPDHRTMKIDSFEGTVGQRASGRIIIVTGGAQGFGGGIAEELHAQGAHIVVADLNEEAGTTMVNKLNNSSSENKAVFIRSDVSNPESVANLIDETVLQLGGLDVIISNAGILRAGGLDEMDPATFELMTKVNYTGYFLCAKYASKVMKTQAQFAPTHYMDIIQINSKSGLKGSNRNFAYAGGKFGGIGLTQSFALELMPHNIKVNSVCPGNFFEGPLWSDPEKGLFVQYLKAGKVPGAKTIEDVKLFYENQVPAKRGCRVIDVARAILYVMEQEYETGQAIPVTGGQEMLK
jgi:NAD(P)-dependent dehydrogenase (short-subunit alcohol dehydrogenase family)